MTRRAFRFTAIDTWFFRDGTPFDQDASLQSGVTGSFPPSPSTVVGAIRAALALQNGWNGRSRWPTALNDVLGNGPSDLGQLCVTGPFVLKDDQPIFPLPRHVVGRLEGDEWRPQALLLPSGDFVLTDLGKVRLPTLPEEGLKQGEGLWVTRSGFEKILKDELPAPEDLLREDTLWSLEDRVGIQRGDDSRTTLKEGGLYSTRHVRPLKGVSLGVEVTGIPEDWKSPAGSLVPLGGEGRLAACEEWGTGLSIDVDLGYPALLALIVLTPLFASPAPETLLAPGGLRVLSACVERPLRIGGWDSLQGEPLPLKNALAPGSVLFCEAEDFDDLLSNRRGALVRVSDASSSEHSGFGLCALAHLPNSTTTKGRT